MQFYIFLGLGMGVFQVDRQNFISAEICTGVLSLTAGCLGVKKAKNRSSAKARGCS